MNYTEAYTTYGVKVIISPDVPNNEGAFRPFRITAPAGSILNVQRARPPVAARHVIGHFLPHVIAGALGQAVPDRVMAEGSANIWGIQVSGKDRADQPIHLHLLRVGRYRSAADQGRAVGHRLSLGRARHPGRGHRESVAVAHREEGSP